MSAEQTSSTISFEAKLYNIGSWTILRLPREASAQLPSRGQVMVEGAINGFQFQSPLEPDGRLSHWLRIDADLSAAIKAGAGDTVQAKITPTQKWPEPEIPTDLMEAVIANPQVYDLWQHITPLARWEWIRWTRATSNSETRKKRIEVAISKMQHGERRPCCWNRNLCTEPEVSKSGMLLEPTK